MRLVEDLRLATRDLPTHRGQDSTGCRLDSPARLNSLRFLTLGAIVPYSGTVGDRDRRTADPIFLRPDVNTTAPEAICRHPLWQALPVLCAYSIIRAAGPWTDTLKKILRHNFFPTHHGELITTIASHNTNSSLFSPFLFLEYSQSSTQTRLIAKTRLKSSIRCVHSQILIKIWQPRRPQLVKPKDLTSLFQSLLMQNHQYKRSLVPPQRLPKSLPSPNKSHRRGKSKNSRKISCLWTRQKSRCRPNLMKKKKKSRS